MMKSKFLVLILITFGVTFFAVEVLCAEEFEFKYHPGYGYEMRTRIAEEVYVDGEYSHTSKIAIDEFLSINKQKPNRQYEVSGSYMISENTSSLGVVYQVKKEYRDNPFLVSPRGKYKGDLNNFMPVKRDFPLFQHKKINRGDKWFASSYEMHDLSVEPFGYDYPYEIPSAISYYYSGNKKIDGKNYSILKTKTSIMHEPNPVPVRYQLYPIRISGYNEGEILWDNEKGQVFQVHENFDITFELSDGQEFRYKGESQSDFMKMRVLTAEELQALKNQFGDAGVKVGPDWIRITLNKINFGPEAYKITPEESIKLELIANELKHYKGRIIKVVGHTAKAGTEAGQKALSNQRAEVVRNYLVEKGVVDTDLIRYEGKGATARLDTSGSKNGMAKNRRVEIYIYVKTQ